MTVNDVFPSFKLSYTFQENARVVSRTHNLALLRVYALPDNFIEDPTTVSNFVPGPSSTGQHHKTTSN